MKPSQKLCLLLMNGVVEQGTDGLGSAGKDQTLEKC